MAVCVGIVAKENYPLYIRCAPNCDDEVKYHFTVHTSLDVIEEKLASVGKPASISSSPQDLREFYLGQLYPAEDYRAYGYVTNTKIKFVIVVEASNTLIRDNEIRGIFRRLHNAFTEVICNPFYQYGEPIASKSFEKLISTILVDETKKENPFA